MSVAHPPLALLGQLGTRLITAAAQEMAFYLTILRKIADYLYITFNSPQVLILVGVAKHMAALALFHVAHGYDPSS
jgi:hypothetical protein